MRFLASVGILFAVGLFAPGASAVVVSQTNAVFGTVVDDSSSTRTVTFLAGDFTASSIINKATITIDFSKCGDRLNSTGCDGANLNPFANEIAFVVTSPTGTNVILVENDGNDETLDTGNFETFVSGGGSLSHIVITFDDVGAALGGLPASGTFAPEGSLAAFVGESGIGTWTLFYEDDVNLDSLGVHSFTVNLEVDDEVDPGDVSEPATLGLLGLGLAGLGMTRRRRRA